MQTLLSYVLHTGSKKKEKKKKKFFSNLDSRFVQKVV